VVAGILTISVVASLWKSRKAAEKLDLTE